MCRPIFGVNVYVELLRKHVDLIAGGLALGWGVVVTLVEGAAPLAQHVSAEAAFSFAFVAMARWAYGASR